MLNGVPMFDFNMMINYDPSYVKKLEIVTRTRFYGNMAFSGIFNFVGYDNSLHGFEPDPHSMVIDYAGLQSQREFFSPVYETPRQVVGRLADFRKLLYWSPDIKTNDLGEKEISFYSSDIGGKFVVVYQSISKDGKTGTGVIEFVVKGASQK